MKNVNCSELLKSLYDKVINTCCIIIRVRVSNITCMSNQCVKINI